MWDVLIKSGSVVDGSGAPPCTADIAISNGAIAAVGRLDGTASRVIDADGALVTLGWVDVHTHYDGQVTWDDTLETSACHGVTTIVMGNCGVGFAPVRPGDTEVLIDLMEGVEDIPGSALSVGMPWGSWESFAEYLDVIDLDRLTIHAPELRYDLPTGASRIMQSASGYVATLVNGVVVRDSDHDTGARPGRLVRGGHG